MKTTGEGERNKKRGGTSGNCRPFDTRGPVARVEIAGSKEIPRRRNTCSKKWERFQQLTARRHWPKAERSRFRTTKTAPGRAYQKEDWGQEKEK